jgi:hypothetical protein
MEKNNNGAARAMVDVIGEMEMLNSLANFGIQSRFCLSKFKYQL